MLRMSYQQRLILLGLVVVYSFSYFVFALGSIHLNPPKALGILPNVASAIVGAAMALLFVFFFSKLEIDDRLLLPLAAAGIALDVVFNRTALRWAPLDAPLNNLTAGDLLTSAIFIGAANLGLLVAATMVGLIVARGMKGPHYLVMAAIVGAVTDIFSVNWGPSSKVIDNGSVFPYVSYQWGLIGGGSVCPCVGMGDFVFLALYFAGARKFGLNETRTYIYMNLAFMAGFLSLTLGLKGIPFLPFMATFLLVGHAGDLRRIFRERAAASPAASLAP